MVSEVGGSSGLNWRGASADFAGAGDAIPMPFAEMEAAAIGSGGTAAASGGTTAADGWAGSEARAAGCPDLSTC
jgi:hypothetical protein